MVITADHGEMLGDRQTPIPVRGFDHRERLYVPELVNVPWYELDVGDRREVRSDPPVKPMQVDEGVKQQRLEALGYV